MGIMSKDRGTFQGITREWLYWYNQQEERLLTPEEVAAAEKQRRQAAENRADEAERRVQKLAEQLRAAGIEPDL
jgi:hypothetical protein